MVANIVAVIEEAQEKALTFDEIEALQQNWKKSGIEDSVKKAQLGDATKTPQQKLKDYSKMSKKELEDIADEALEKNDVKTLEEISPYIREHLIKDLRMPSLYEYNKFQRGLDPKEAMETGLRHEKCCVCKKPKPMRYELIDNSYFICDDCQKEGWDFDPAGGLHKFSNDDDDFEDYAAAYESHITKSYDTPMTREMVMKLIQRIIIKHRDTALPIKSMKHWLDLNNFGSYSDNKWIRAITDTLFKKMGGSWERININLTLDQLTDKVMDFWKNKFSIHEKYIMPSLYEYDNDDEDEEDYTVPESAEEAPHKYWDQQGDYEKERDMYWKKLIPNAGHADTIQGEVLRCFNNIMYDRYNNGFGNDRSDEAIQIYNFRDKFTPYMKNPNDFYHFFNMYKKINFGYNRTVADTWEGDKYLDPILDGIIRWIMHTDGEFEQLPDSLKYLDQ